jgi:hypothetical protein
MPYRYSGDFIERAAGAFNVQKSNMGMVEFHLNELIPGAQEVLALGFKTANIPQRKIARGEIQYFNGTVFYPARPEPLGEMSVTFHDYINALVREALEGWCNIVYEEDTGLMALSSQVKIDATLVLFGANGVVGRTYDLEGVFPMGKPDFPIDHGTGDPVMMEMSFSVDRIKAAGISALL